MCIFAMTQFVLTVNKQKQREKNDFMNRKSKEMLR